ncbi:hypothetical protein HNQ59_003722 [Chitinivorax tropicus]|uniref:Peptidase C-terminal archaeal/bacterial domain-containing protein n=1 Tax=Chitinivorax tropicus TaxID=714531 RepID=A0A840MVM6_9PROT|nr:hypothetical protein [Chitinivorax tropicus]MBB5020403.1 hypothetical protein [Chitinivorax tropicus]
MKRFGITLLAAWMLGGAGVFAAQPNLQPNAAASASGELPIPSSATILSEGLAQPDLPASVSETKWYRIDNTTKRKLTVQLTGPSTPGVDYDLYFYRTNAAGTALQQVALSQFKTQATEQLSYIADVGTYYVGVNAASGLDTANPFQLVFRASTGHDISEPDDSPWQAPKLTLKTPFTLLNHTKDQDEDQDWQKLELGKETELMAMLHKNDDQTIPYENIVLNIFNDQFSLVKTITAFSFSQVKLGKGAYYLQFAGGKAGSGYSLRIKEVLPPQANRVQITKIDSSGGVAGFMNYGHGNKWRVKGDITVNGTAFGSNDQPIANAPVKVSIWSRLNNAYITASANTSANGTFNIPLKLVPAIGNHQYDNSISWHYYDIVDIQFNNGEKNIPANIFDLYHFAYQIRK